MGRAPKKGLGYSVWDTDIFENERKIDKLLDAQGWIGFSIYFYLCTRAYGGEGYYYSWCYDDCASTARKMGGGISASAVRETVAYCLQIGLFDNRLFEEWNVLSSTGIQKRYMEAIKKRDCKNVIAEYWLLQDGENCKGLLKSPKNGGNKDFRDGNADFRAGNSDFRAKSKVKEIKENKSKDVCSEQKSSEPAVIELPLNDGSLYPITQSMVDEWSRLYQAVDVMVQLRKMVGWLNANKKRRKTKKGILRFITNWLSSEQDKHHGGSYSAVSKPKNMFNDFPQREYDYDELLQKTKIN